MSGQAAPTAPAAPAAAPQQTPNVDPTPQSDLTPPAAAPAAPAPVDNSWVNGLNDETKAFVETKGFKDPASVLDSYRNLEKLMGAPRDKLLKIPETDDLDGMNEFYNKLGRPKEAKEYEFELPEGAASESFTEWAKNTFHAEGLTSDQAKGFMEKYGEFYESEMQAEQEQYEADVNTQKTKLTKEWGAAHEQNMMIARSAAKTLGMGTEQIDALERVLGYDGVMKMFHGVGTKTGEASFHDGDGGLAGGALTPGQAMAKIKELRRDKNFAQKLGEKDAKTVNEWNQLHVWANPEQ